MVAHTDFIERQIYNDDDIMCSFLSEYLLILLHAGPRRSTLTIQSVLDASFRFVDDISSY